MSTLVGMTTLGELPEAIPGSHADEVWVERGARADEVILHDQQYVTRLTLYGLVGDLVWRRHLDERVLALASEHGNRGYMVDLVTWSVLHELFIWRDEDRYWSRMNLLVTPDGQHCVFFSDETIHALTWRGVMWYARRINTTDDLISLGNHSITLLDEPNGGLEFTLPFPPE
jgi:hypothetical protein